MLKDFENRYKANGLAVVGVSMDDDGWKSVKPYIEEKNINYRVMVGDDEITRIYGGLGALPTTLLIDRAGRIAMTHVGLVAKNTYEENVRAVLAER